MWDDKPPPTATVGRAVATLQNVASKRERHNARHNTGTTYITILADAGVMLSGASVPHTDQETGERVTDMGQTSHLPRGSSVYAPKATAKRWINAGAAVPVDTSKMGSAQRALLTRLYDIEQQARAAGVPDIRLRAWRWGGPSESTGPRRRGVPWKVENMTDRPVTPTERGRMSNALRALERRGLVIRDAPAGSGQRTRYVQLTDAGRTLARECADAAPRE